MSKKLEPLDPLEEFQIESEGPGSGDVVTCCCCENIVPVKDYQFFAEENHHYWLCCVCANTVVPQISSKGGDMSNVELAETMVTVASMLYHDNKFERCVECPDCNAVCPGCTLAIIISVLAWVLSVLL